MIIYQLTDMIYLQLPYMGSKVGIYGRAGSSGIEAVNDAYNAS